jgi:hypothetical protein
LAWGKLCRKDDAVVAYSIPRPDAKVKLQASYHASEEPPGSRLRQTKTWILLALVGFDATLGSALGRAANRRRHAETPVAASARSMSRRDTIADLRYLWPAEAAHVPMELDAA